MEKRIDIDLWSAACSGDIMTLKDYFELENGEVNVRYNKFGKKHSLIMGAYRNNQFDTVDYLMSVGEKITDEEFIELSIEYNRLKYMERLVG